MIIILIKKVHLTFQREMVFTWAPHTIYSSDENYLPHDNSPFFCMCIQTVVWQALPTVRKVKQCDYLLRIVK